MSEQNEHLEHLEAIRSHLVELRRYQAKYGALNNGQEDAAAHIVVLQNQIRAIDEALDDEKNQAPSVYETRGILTLEG